VTNKKTSKPVKSDLERLSRIGRKSDEASVPGIQLLHTIKSQQSIKSAAWLRNVDKLAYSTSKGIFSWDLGYEKEEQLLSNSGSEILSFSWSPDGSMLAVSFSDKSVHIFETHSRQITRTFQSRTELATEVHWSPTGDKIAWVAGQHIELRYLSTKFSTTLSDHSSFVNNCDWSPDGNILASCSDDQTIRLWRDRGAPKILASHFGPVLSVSWSPTGRTIVTSSSDATIRFWSPRSGKEIGHIEGHTDAVLRTSFSPDGRILVSSSRDGSVRVWRSDSWEALGSLTDFADERTFINAVGFHSSKPLLFTASTDNSGSQIRIWKVDVDVVLNNKAETPSVHYTNAKVVLVGDTGVGKSGLGLVLSGRPFVPTESTHGRHVWTLERAEIDIANGRTETRETLLWDLAGQPGYRLIHQLYLREVSVALVLFDARSETNPFAGVHHWYRALEQAQRYGQQSVALIKFLVASRADRGGISVSRTRVANILEEYGFSEVFETSAKELWGISQLREAIRQAIKWDDLPRVTSTLLFQQIKAFLIEEKIAGRLMSTNDDIYDAFLKADSKLEASRDLRAQFETCINLVESRDLIKRLSFGDIVLLQPELLDAYASSIIEAAREEPDGLGCISEEDVLNGRFAMSRDERIQDDEKEKLLLFATIEDLLRHEIALRDQGEDGPYLIFPSQITRTYPDLTDPSGKEIVFHFEGPVLNIYATLAVRLARSGLDTISEMWKNAITYKPIPGGICGILLNDLDEGKGQLIVFFSNDVTEESRQQFDYYVHKHLQRRTLNVRRQRVFACQNCGTEVTELQVERRLKLLDKRALEQELRNKQRSRTGDGAAKRAQIKKSDRALNCNVCDSRIPLRDRHPTAPETLSIPEMDHAADMRREREAATSVLQGKIATSDFDVFLCHNSGDKAAVKEIGERLKARGILPWLDEWELQPGLPWQHLLENQLSNIKSAAVFIGPTGLGPWQDLELDTFLRQFVKRRVPVIPILLGECDKVPSLPPFLEGMTWVDFRKSDPDPLEQLIWGITGQRRVIK
jgi:small GTP-binding protein